MKGKAACEKARRAYRELKKRNEVQAQTIEHMRNQYVEKLDALQLRETALASASNTLKERYS